MKMAHGEIMSIMCENKHQRNNQRNKSKERK